MACKVRYLSSAGIQQREIKGLNALAAAYPSNWLVYASLNAFPRGGPPIEIDVIVVMDDRIVLLELKDWNGVLASNGDNWMLGRSKRGRSAVTLGNEKAKKIKGMIRDAIPQLGGVYVDSRVVLTGTATNEHLPESEQPFVLTLDEARNLADKKLRNELLGPVRLSKTRPDMFVKDFERLFGNASQFQPRKMDWDGYEVTDENFFVHRGDVWREHRAHRRREERVKALLRLFSFDRLPAGLNDPDGRRAIADRETRVVGHLGDQGSWLAERGVLKEVGTPPDEILTQHHQLVSVPNGWTTLHRYLERNGAELTGEQRVDIAHTLASMVAELHAHGIAHRDIGGASVWMGAPTTMSLTGFFSARLPDDVSVSDFRHALATYAEPEPDWGVAVTATEHDVRSLGLIMRDLAALDGGSSVLPPGWDDVVEKALAPPGERYPEARALAEALGELRTPSGPSVDQSRLDEFETSDVPYVTFPPTGAPVAGARATRYESAGPDGRVVVKVWNGLLRGDARRDNSLLAMLETAAALRAVPARGVAPVLAAGLSPVGPFAVMRWVDGEALEGAEPLGEEALLAMLAELASALEGLHARGLAHGDLHPGNVLLAAEGGVALLDLLDVSPLGGGQVRSPAFAPVDHERRSDQQIDRFAVCRIAETLTADRPEPSLRAVAECARAELARVAIETLDPLTEVVDRERRRLLVPPPRAFRVTAPTLPSRAMDTDDGHLWVKSYRQQDLESFFVAGLNGRLLVRLRGGAVDAIEPVDLRLQDLAQGVRVPMSLILATGPEHGAQELAEFLREVAPVEEADWSATTIETDESDAPASDWDEDEEPEETSPADEGGSTRPTAFGHVDVSRLWSRSAEIEEDAVLTVRLDNRIADVGGSAVFRYETPRPLEFEDEDAVEVRLAPGVQGRKIGHLDVPRCDDDQIAIKDLRGPLAGGGEHVALIDRRDRVSKERRRRAVERLTGRRSVIPNLIDFFDQLLDLPDEAYDLSATDEELQAYGLNEGQKAALRHILNFGPLGLLQGPPGSGKTRFIAALSHWLLTRRRASRPGSEPEPRSGQQRAGGAPQDLPAAGRNSRPAAGGLARGD